MTQVVTRNGINHSNYMEHTSEINQFDKDIPEDLTFLIKMMLKNDPAERIGWLQFY